MRRCGKRRGFESSRSPGTWTRPRTTTRGIPPPDWWVLVTVVAVVVVVVVLVVVVVVVLVVVVAAAGEDGLGSGFCSGLRFRGFRVQGSGFRDIRIKG